MSKVGLTAASAHRRASRDSSGHRRPSHSRSLHVRRPPVASLDTRPGQARFLLFPLPAGSASPNYPQRICRKYPSSSIPGKTDKVPKDPQRIGPPQRIDRSCRSSGEAPISRSARPTSGAKAEGVDHAQKGPTFFKNLAGVVPRPGAGRFRMPCVTV